MSSLCSAVDLHISETVLQLPAGLQMPAKVVTNQPSIPVVSNEGYAILLAHGLGFGNPQRKDHNKDDWLPIVGNVFLSDSTVSAAVYYTARGHGASTGWEDTAEHNPTQFSWNSLSTDMKNVADALHFEKFVACGSSMGSATSLFAAINFPEHVSGLIMIRPPTGWEERALRKEHILESAQKLKELNLKKGNGLLHHLVLVGATTADLPPLDDLVEAYGKVKCPVLILATRGDSSHPEISAHSIFDRLSNAASKELHFVDDIVQANKEWPEVIKSFIKKLQE